jgi:hypothetical protein
MFLWDLNLKRALLFYILVQGRVAIPTPRWFPCPLTLIWFLSKIRKETEVPLPYFRRRIAGLVLAKRLKGSDGKFNQCVFFKNFLSDL